MQYFYALKIGQNRTKEAALLLKRYTDSALPAIAVKEVNNTWEPVGEENYVGLVKQKEGYMICICDKDGNAKAVATWYSEEDANKILNKMIEDGFKVYEGRIRVPI